MVGDHLAEGVVAAALEEVLELVCKPGVCAARDRTLVVEQPSPRGGDVEVARDDEAVGAVERLLLLHRSRETTPRVHHVQRALLGQPFALQRVVVLQVPARKDQPLASGGDVSPVSFCLPLDQPLHKIDPRVQRAIKRVRHSGQQLGKDLDRIAQPGRRLRLCSLGRRRSLGRRHWLFAQSAGRLGVRRLHANTAVAASAAAAAAATAGVVAATHPPLETLLPDGVVDVAHLLAREHLVRAARSHEFRFRLRLLVVRAGRLVRVVLQRQRPVRLL
mmetsp:Transcript_4881/g.15844  ORF Transcript_4881/g.15844 Transcript_4881/m.15844 type:complete len:275 (+) Transcript_4881:634-1458(+)